MSRRPIRNRASPLSGHDLERLRRLLEAMGEARVREALELPRHTLARLLAGLAVHAGTRALVLGKLALVERAVQSCPSNTCEGS